MKKEKNACSFFCALFVTVVGCRSGVARSSPLILEMTPEQQISSIILYVIVRTKKKNNERKTTLPTPDYFLVEEWRQERRGSHNRIPYATIDGITPPRHNISFLQFALASPSGGDNSSWQHKKEEGEGKRSAECSFST